MRLRLGKNLPIAHDLNWKKIMAQLTINLNNSLKSILNNNISSFSKGQLDLINRNSAATVSTLGITLGQKVNGVLPLSQIADDLTPLAASSVTSVVSKTAIAEVTNSVPGFNLSAPSVIIGSAAPEALAAAMKSAGAKKTDIVSNLNSLQTSPSSFMDDIVESSLTNTQSFLTSSITNSLFNRQKSILSMIDNGVGNVLGDILEQNALKINTTITLLAVKSSGLVDIPPEVRKKIVSAISNKNLDEAAKLIGMYSDKSFNEIKQQLIALDISINAAEKEELTTVKQKYATQASSSTGKTIKSTEVRDNNYPLVATEEELMVELKDIQREITECVIQWTETAKDQNLTARDFNDLLSEQDKTIPYHYLILRNGNLQRCRPLKDVGGALNNSHESYSIQIAFVGGINANSRNKDYAQYLSSDSFTSEQFKTFDTFLRILYGGYPGIQVLGLNSINVNEKAPGFSVESYIASKFNKHNISDDFLNSGPLTRKQLIAKRIYDD